MDMMDRPEIEELLSCMLDGELSVRQYNELARLLMHDKNAAAALVQLRKQKELLNSLPVEQAPAGLAKAVKAQMERELILEQCHRVCADNGGAAQLFVRRLVTAAALVILPIGVLTLIVVNIIKPAGPADTRTVGNPASHVEQSPAEIVRPKIGGQAAGASVFVASLRFQTNQPSSVSNYIDKAVYNNGLVDVTVSSRTTSQAGYNITCGQSGIAALLNDIETVWSRAVKVDIDIYGTCPSAYVRVENITPEQVIELFRQQESLGRAELARHFARLNSIYEDTPGYKIFNTPHPQGMAGRPYIVPVKPILTSGEKPSLPIADDDMAGGEISLIITVAGL